jgi:hypothetical protein
MREKPGDQVDRESFWLATSGFRAKEVSGKKSEETMWAGATTLDGQPSLSHDRTGKTDGKRAFIFIYFSYSPQNPLQKCPHALGARVVEHLGRRSLFQNASIAQDDHAVGGAAGEADLVGHHEQRHALAL